MIDSQGCCLTFYTQFIVIFWGSILCSVHFLEKAKKLNKFVRNMYLQINKVLNEVQFFIMCHLITTYIDKKKEGGVIKKSSEVKWQRVDVHVYPLKGGRCVFKWILRGHFKPTPNATIQIMFVGISIIFWYFWSTIDVYEAISLTQTFVGA